MLLQADLVVLKAVRCGGPIIADSVSQFYHLGSHSVFVAALATVGVLLAAYHGWRENSLIDRLLGGVAGIGALGVAFLPTPYLGKENTTQDFVCRGLSESLAAFGPTNDIIPNVLTFHYLFAGVLFGILIYFCWFSFQRSTGGEDPNWKLVRNGTYRALAFIMAVAIAVIVATNFGSWNAVTKPYHPTFWGETVALMAFGTAWLIRSRALLGYQNQSSGLAKYKPGDEDKPWWQALAILASKPQPAKPQ